MQKYYVINVCMDVKNLHKQLLYCHEYLCPFACVCVGVSNDAATSPSQTGHQGVQSSTDRSAIQSGVSNQVPIIGKQTSVVQQTTGP